MLEAFVLGKGLPLMRYIYSPPPSVRKDLRFVRASTSNVVMKGLEALKASPFDFNRLTKDMRVPTSIPD